MREPDPFPVNVDVDRAANAMVIEWEGGQKSTYTGEQLRWACPCAECHGEGGAPGRLDRVEKLQDDELHLQDVTLIGQYALQIAFASGHATGLYTFTHLRKLGT